MKEGHGRTQATARPPTGHSKGGAAAWMLNGVLQCVLEGVVPGNRNADNVDPKLEQFEYLVYPNCTLKGLQARNSPWAWKKWKCHNWSRSLWVPKRPVATCIFFTLSPVFSFFPPTRSPITECSQNLAIRQLKFVSADLGICVHSPPSRAT